MQGEIPHSERSVESSYLLFRQEQIGRHFGEARTIHKEIGYTKIPRFKTGRPALSSCETDFILICMSVECIGQDRIFLFNPAMEGRK